MSTQVETKNTAATAPSKGSPSSAAASGKDSLSMMSAGPVALAMLEVYKILGNELKIAKADADQKAMSLKIQSDQCVVAANSIESAGALSAAQMFTQAGTTAVSAVGSFAVNMAAYPTKYADASKQLTDNEVPYKSLTDLKTQLADKAPNLGLGPTDPAMKLTDAQVQELADGKLLDNTNAVRSDVLDNLAALRDRSQIETDPAKAAAYKLAYNKAQDSIDGQISRANTQMKIATDKISEVSNSKRTISEMLSQTGQALGNTTSGFLKIYETKQNASTELSRTGSSMAASGVQSFDQQMSKQFDFAAQALKVLEAIESSTKGN